MSMRYELSYWDNNNYDENGNAPEITIAVVANLSKALRLRAQSPVRNSIWIYDRLSDRFIYYPGYSSGYPCKSER